MKIIMFFLLCLFLMSCGKHSDGTSVWAEGLWIIPVAEIIGLLIFVYQWQKRQSVGYLWFVFIMLCALVGTVIWVNAEK